MTSDASLPQQAPLTVSDDAAPHRHMPTLDQQARPNNIANGHGEDDTTRSDNMTATTLQDTCADLHGRVTRFISAAATNETMRRTQEQTQVAMSVIEKALQDYDFDALSMSYNGGKDCLVLLILYLAVLHTHFTQPSGRRRKTDNSDNVTTPSTDSDTTTTSTTPRAFPKSIPSIYAKPPDPFDSVTSFVDHSTQFYHLDLMHISTNPGPSVKSRSHTSPPQTVRSDRELLDAVETATTPNGTVNSIRPLHFAPEREQGEDSTSKTITFRDAFALYLQTRPTTRAIFVGTRRTDPHGATLAHFQMTDGNWPRFVRVHPVIDWRLGEIWCFLRSPLLADPRTGEPLPYCRMYDEGYTSLGGKGDTLRNPRLRCVDEGDGVERYKPAYEMTEDEEERAGRE